MWLFSCLFIAISIAAAQRLEFDVASVKLSPAHNGNITIFDDGGPGSPTPAVWSCNYCDLQKLLSKAYALKPFQIEGPPWLRGQQFHISARLPASATRHQFREMLRNLLIDRFALAAHLESRIAPQLEITVAKGGPKLVRSQPTTALPGARKPVAMGADGYPALSGSPGEQESITIHGRTRLYYPDSPVADLAEKLSFHLARPVIDLTGLQANYDIRLYWADEDSGLDGGIDLKDALRDQLGLLLQEKKGPVQFLVVEHVEKLPTGNE
jgi:uncharacterized protein (TIGR03435 family)